MSRFFKPKKYILYYIFLLLSYLFQLGCNISLKVHIFLVGHKIFRNLHLTLDWHSIGQKQGEDFAKFRGLRIYELYFESKTYRIFFLFCLLVKINLVKRKQFFFQPFYSFFSELYNCGHNVMTLFFTVPNRLSTNSYLACTVVCKIVHRKFRFMM